MRLPRPASAAGYYYVASASEDRMTRGHLLTIVSMALWVSATRALLAQPDDRIERGPNRHAAPGRARRNGDAERVGQTISGTLVEPLYAYDRVVLPAGTPVVGHLASLENPSKLTRFRAWSSADFSPRRHATLAFDRDPRGRDDPAARAGPERDAEYAAPGRGRFPIVADGGARVGEHGRSRPAGHQAARERRRSPPPDNEPAMRSRGSSNPAEWSGSS